MARRPPPADPPPPSGAAGRGAAPLGPTGVTETWGDKPARLIVPVTELRKRLGQRREVPVEVVLARQQVLDSHTVQTPVRGEVTVESIERGVSVLGRVTFSWEGDCRRCLELVQGTTEIDIDEIFQVDAPPDSELIDFDGDRIDLVPILRDAVGLSLPLAPLCRPDCPGPDPDRYPAQTEVEAEAATSPDPRWAALRDFDFN